MAEVGRLESCKAEVMRRLIKDKWSDVETVCAASHLLTPAIPPMFDAAVSNDRMPNSGQVQHLLLLAHDPVDQRWVWALSLQAIEGTSTMSADLRLATLYIALPAVGMQ